MNTVRCSVTVQAKTNVYKSVMERCLVDGLSGIPVPFYCYDFLMLPIIGSLANLTYDDILGKIFRDSLLSLGHLGHLPSLTDDISFLQ